MTQRKKLNTRIVAKSSHLKIEDREDIEAGLTQGLNFKEIAYHLRRDPSTISKEVRRNRIRQEAVLFNDKRNNCIFAKTCKKQHVCENRDCRKFCRTCHCNDLCPDFIPFVCKRHTRAPYVCNGCDEKKRCPADRYFYRAMTAQKRYQETLVSSRQGINATADQIACLNELLTPLIKRNQSVNHIYGSHRKELGISKSTFYTYCDLSLFTFRNIDLQRKVRYKPRKKAHRPTLDQSYLNGRKYTDFKEFMEVNSDKSVVEMDVVETIKGERVFLTFFFRKTKLMLAFIMEKQDQKCVSEVLDYLENLLGLRVFQEIFPVILTDNGGEFKHADIIEHSITGARRCSVYYCDPMASHQKCAIEKNHEFIREYIPKSTSIRFCNQELTTLMINHINSIKRDSINEKTPYDLAELLMPPITLKLLGLQRIHPDFVTRNPSIFKQ